MRFEHIIQINGGGQPLLSREDVWRGLALRAYDPTHFILGLEACAIRHHEQAEDGREELHRTLHFGAFEVEDIVQLEPLHEVRVRVAATEQWAHSTALARIEEPEPLSLFVRFIYEWDDASPAEQVLTDMERGMREQALQALDLDTVRRIRELAATGLS